MDENFTGHVLDYWSTFQKSKIEHEDMNAISVLLHHSNMLLSLVLQSSIQLLQILDRMN